MKGDFSRSTFDPRKHYSSVRMQQGRVQLDADWNEQVDILLHLIRTQLADVVGPAGTAAPAPGFAITLPGPAKDAEDQARADEPGEPAAPPRALPDLQIGAGRYYVDGILCENEESVPFSQQPDNPDAADRLKELSNCDQCLVYLDVWERHITAIEDPAIREIALGGADTTTRARTVWQVKLLPLSGDEGEYQGWHKGDPLSSLPAWKQMVTKATNKGQLQARWKQGDLVENHLYRVEIHSVTGDQATFKWSRENGSVIFPVVPPKDPARVQVDTEGRLGLTVEQLDRDPDRLREGFWVELVDDVTELNRTPLPLYQVAEVDRSRGCVTLRAESQEMDQIAAELRKPELRHRLLRRWEAGTKPVARRREHAGADDDWLDLEHGIQVGFSPEGTYQPGDYWLIPARTRAEHGIEWPQEGDHPQALPPHGIAHHYAPLALLQFEKGEWCRTADGAARFDMLPELGARLGRDVARLEARLGELEAQLGERVADVARLAERVTVLEERQADFQAPLVQYFRIADEIQTGHVVAIVPPDASDEPESELRVRLASGESEVDRRLVVGVVKAIPEDGDDSEFCRVVLYGQAQCKVVGDIRPGDLLVPAKRPGYAQKAGRAASPATILGKALGPLKLDAEAMEEIDEGKRSGKIGVSELTGTVDMMVTLG
jgi:Family of unknown function (DUF6519)